MSTLNNYGHHAVLLTYGSTAASAIMLIILKFKNNTFISTLGILFIVLSLFSLIFACFPPLPGNISAIFCFSSLYVGLILIWLHEGGKFPIIIHRHTTILKKELISLKALYDNGTINEEEYTQRKAEIINKL